MYIYIYIAPYLEGTPHRKTDGKATVSSHPMAEDTNEVVAIKKLDAESRVSALSDLGRKSGLTGMLQVYTTKRDDIYIYTT